ncbi:MAG: hypothetical protein M1814_001232 [Vezdaea aestivalis]|nr:MAG: hypothetical protein M1814_001232 [Vezdaea aestivalis]
MKAGLSLYILFTAASRALAAQPLYAQCGGQAYFGDKTCQPPGICECTSQWFSQCLNPGILPAGVARPGCGSSNPGGNGVGAAGYTPNAGSPVVVQPTYGGGAFSSSSSTSGSYKGPSRVPYQFYADNQPTSNPGAGQSGSGNPYENQGGAYVPPSSSSSSPTPAVGSPVNNYGGGYVPSPSSSSSPTPAAFSPINNYGGGYVPPSSSPPSVASPTDNYGGAYVPPSSSSPQAASPTNTYGGGSTNPGGGSGATNPSGGTSANTTGLNLANYVVQSGRATSTRYGPGGQSACGNNGGWQAYRPDGLYTVALPGSMYQGDFCGKGCGVCYQITSTGQPPAVGIGPPNQPMNSVTAIVTNKCGTDGKWCVGAGSKNEYGYEYHFDFMDPPSGWDNVVVDFAPVACPQALLNDWTSTGSKCPLPA